MYFPEGHNVRRFSSEEQNSSEKIGNFIHLQVKSCKDMGTGKIMFFSWQQAGDC